MIFDEGVYLNSLRLLESDRSLGHDVYASQPPGFYLLLQLAALVVKDSETSLRLAFTALTIAGLAAVFYLARVFGGFVAGGLAVLALAASPICSQVGTHVAADGPAASVSAIGVAVAVAAWLRWQSAPPTSLALSGLAGALIAFAISIKLTSVTTAAAIAALYVLFRPPMRSVAAMLGGGLCVAAALIGTYWTALPELWRDAVALHLDARALRGSEVSAVGGTVGLHDNFIQIVHSLLPKTSVSSWLFVSGVLLLVATSSGRDRRRLMLLVWPAVVGLFLLLHRPLFYHHVYLLAVATSAPSGIGLARILAIRWQTRLPRLTGHAAVPAVVAVLLFQAWRTAAPSESAESGGLGRMVALIRSHTSPQDYVVASDIPIVAFRAHRLVPPNLVDTSLVRILTGALRPADVRREIRVARVRAVLVGGRFRRWPNLIGYIARRSQQRYTFGEAVLFVLPSQSRGRTSRR